jgi:hypothetical protein
MKESKLYNIYEGLPSYARGIVVVGLLAFTYIIGKTILDAIEAAAAAKKSAERQKQFQDELNDTNSKSSFPDSQYGSWANSIASSFSGCDWTSIGGTIPIYGQWGYWSDSGSTVYNVIDKFKNDADFLKLQRAFDIKTITKSWACGKDYENVDLTAAITAQLNQQEINALNKLLEEKGIKYRF